MNWYTGQTLIQHLEKVPSRASEAGSVFRLPVQTVLRDGQDFRGLAGTVTSGSVKVGDVVADALSGAGGKVVRIATMGGDLESASAGQAIALQLDVDIDVSRGAVLSSPEMRPVAAQTIEARFVWLSEDAFSPAAGYLLRTSTDLIPVSNIEIKALLDLETMASHPARSCAANDIAIAKISLGRAAAIDVFSETPETGTLLLVDSVSGATVAGGIASAVNAKAEAPTRRPLRAEAGHAREWHKSRSVDEFERPRRIHAPRKRGGDHTSRCRCSRRHRATTAHRRWDGPRSLTTASRQRCFVSTYSLHVTFRRHRHENFCNCGSGCSRVRHHVPASTECNARI